MRGGKAKPPRETTVITCSCGKQIVFAAAVDAVKPTYIQCRKCGKKHIL
jgi:DNA-directed RNA polymerase subunit RPC12/RpoP